MGFYFELLASRFKKSHPSSTPSLPSYSMAALAISQSAKPSGRVIAKSSAPAVRMVVEKWIKTALQPFGEVKKSQ
jgi:hypothetical protein